MNLDPNQQLFVLALAVVVEHGLLLWALIGKQRSNGTAAPSPVVGGASIAVPPVAVPSPPVVSSAPRNTGITATYFTDTAGAYGPIDPVLPGVALPATFSAPRPRVRVFSNGRSVDCDIVDKGPWYDGTAARPADPYWITGARPRAETDPNTNHAGIDLTPGALAVLGLKPVTGKWIVNWDFIDARTPAPAPTPPVTATVLQPNVWPIQAQAGAFYGAPGTNLVKVVCPWLLTVEGTHAQTITVNAKCAASLTRVLNYIWEQCGKSQDRINALGYNIFDGSSNDRDIAGTSTLSMHAYAAALDFNAAANPQHAPLTHTKFKEDSLIVHAFKAESWVWGGDWSPAYIDAMHFQAARV